MNQKGQAMIEAVIVLTLTLFFTAKVVQLGLRLRYEILIDDLTEQTLICHYQKDSTCLSKLKIKLSDLNFKNIEITDLSTKDKAVLRLKLDLDSTTTLTKETELYFDLSI